MKKNSPFDAQKTTAKKHSIRLLLLFAIGIFGIFPTFTNKATAVEFSNITARAPQNVYLSPIKIAPITFTGLGVSWHQKIPPKTSGEIQVRFFNKNTWGEWYPLTLDIDGMESHNYENPASFLPVNPTTTFQYKVILQSNDQSQTPLIEKIEFTYINSNASKKITGPRENLVASIATPSSLVADNSSGIKTDPNLAALTSPDSKSLKIISRAEWGADENLRLYKGTNPEPVLIKEENGFHEKYASELKIVRVADKDSNGNLLTWPLQYPEKVSKIVIHHTATTNGLDDPMKAVRDIYYWHTITRGWGDIGYNYLIDPQGNIYEGRFGGDTVVGAHAGEGNVGSIGIAVLGNYQDNVVPAPVLKSLVALVKAKTKQYNIDPNGSSLFRGENLPNVIGHRDVTSTSCPGENLYAQLPLIRVAAKNGFKATIIDRGANLEVNKKYSFDVAGDVPFFTFEPGGKQEITLNIKNTGPTSWGAGTFIVLNRDFNAGKYLLTDAMVKSDGVKSEIQPNQTATFKIQIQAGYSGGLTMVEFFPMINGSIKVEKYLSLPVQIKSPVYDYEVKEISFAKPYLKKGMVAEAVISLKNTGNITWRKQGKNKFSLGSDNPRDHISKILQTPGTRWGELTENEVAPGQQGHFKVKIKAPLQPGPYHEYFTPVLEDLTWFQNKNTFIDLFVYEKEYQGQLQSDSLPNPNFAVEEKRTMTLKIQNQGGIIWSNQGTNALTANNMGTIKIPKFTVQESKIVPGSNATITFDVQAPKKEGKYMLRIFPKVNGKNILPRPVIITLNVTKTGATPTPISPQNPTKTPIAQTTKPIRIDLSFRGNPIITADGPFIMEGDGKILATFQKDQKITVTYEQNQYRMNGESGSYTSQTPPRFSSPSNILRIDNFERRPSWNPDTNNNEYRGILEANWYKNQIHTINEIPLEEYLKGLGEIDEKQSKEKIRTIIILARTYANFYMKSAEKFPGAPFHLSDDPETSQKYVGYSFEKRSPNTVQAVKDTAGLIVTYQGKLIKTPYFTSDDGRTRSAEEVWGWKDTPYLISVPDPYCKGKTMQGHGVGLSGCGSLGMAQAGKTYEEIIKYYFQGVSITKM